MKLQIEHLEVIWVFMENHTDFAKGRLSVSNSRTKFKELWSNLAHKLNSLGLGTKSVDKWQKTWSDYKGYLKKKAAEINRLLKATGGGPSIKDLTDIEKKILEILGPTFFKGVGIEEKGINVKAPCPGTPETVTSVPITPDATSTSSHIIDQNFQNNENIGLVTLLPNQSSEKRKLGCENDHDISFFSNKNESRKKKKSQIENLNLIYEETINCLKNIENTVANGLNTINNTIRDGLKELTEVLKEKQPHT